MVEPVGRKLQQARLRKQVSVEEAARVTRMRPDKILDLEEDNYSNFPSMSYAKGFLLIYAKFLGVDVSEFADTLHTPNPVSSDDYEYLNAAASIPPPPQSRRSSYTSSFAPRRKPSILPVLAVLVLIAIAFLVFYVMSISRRLGSLDDTSTDRGLPAATALPAISTLPPATPAPKPVAVAATPAFRTSTPAPAPTFNPALEVRRAQPVEAVASMPPAAAATPAPSIAAATPEPMREISVQPLRKTRVTIRRDVADSAPVFEDWLYPTDGPLKVRGRKFWIQVDDPASVQVTEDGKPLAAGQDEVRIE